MVLGSNGTLSPETTSPYALYDKIVTNWSLTQKISFHSLLVRMTKTLSLEAEINCLHGQNLSPLVGLLSFVTRVTVLPG